MSDPYLDDLLRRSSPSRAHGLLGRLFVLVLILCIAAAGYWYLFVFHTSQPSLTPQAMALEMASQTMSRSIEAARLPLAVTPPQEGGEGKALEVAPVVGWKKGEAMTLSGQVQKDESVFAALQKRALENQSIHLVLDATKALYNFRYSRPGDQWEAMINPAGVITRFRYQTSPEDIWEAALASDGKTYQVVKVEVPIERRQVAVGGTVSASLWGSMEASGLSPTVASKYIDMFLGVVDFGAQARPGDHFALVYEKLFLHGEELRDGKVLGARYVDSQGVAKEVFYFGEDEATAGYYSPEGKSVQREFLKSPLGNVRITSGFGKRFHPVLKSWKMHAGVDYGAPTGTPVRAISEGVVKWAKWKGPNGNLVIIAHKNGHSSHYAHLSMIPEAIKPGVKVTRKTVIGRVGSTGRSTGPHLHFGLKRAGRFIDPLATDLMRSPPLKGAPKKAFQERVVQLLMPKLDRALAGVRPKKDHDSIFAPPDEG